MAGSPATVAGVLRQQLHSRGEHPWLICDADRLTYGEADRRSALLAGELMARGAGKGTHVGLLYPNGSEFVIAMLATARIGAVVIPFSSFATAPELREQLVHSDTEILLTTGSYRSHDYARRVAEVLGGDASSREPVIFDSNVPQLRHVLVDGRPDESVDDSLLTAMEDDVDGSDPLAIVYTSGSTSSPKGVIHTHAALLEHQRNLNQIRRLEAADRLFCNSPFFWIGGFAFGVLATLVAGSTLLCSNADDAVTLDLIENEKPTLTNGFAAGIAHLARHPGFSRRDLSSLRRGNLYPIMAEAARPADPELRHNMLGMTEAGSVLLISEDESDQPEHRRGSYGRPAPGFDTSVVDPETAAPVDAGQVGELCIRGPYLMQRYHRRSREECFDSDGWFHTGDLVRVDDEGFFYFVGRRGAMIKTAGANVAPAEVERAIAAVADGTVAHVIGLPDPQRGQLVAAVIVADSEDGAGLDEEALRARLGSELSAYKIPRRFVVVPRADVPLLSSGKVDIGRLAGLFDV